MVHFEIILGENMGNKDQNKGSSWHNAYAIHTFK